MQPRPSTCNVAASGTKRNGPPQLAKAVANFCLAESNTKWDLPSCRHWQKFRAGQAEIPGGSMPKISAWNCRCKVRRQLALKYTLLVLHWTSSALGVHRYSLICQELRLSTIMSDMPSMLLNIPSLSRCLPSASRRHTPAHVDWRTYGTPTEACSRCGNVPTCCFWPT